MIGPSVPFGGTVLISAADRSSEIRAFYDNAWKASPGDRDAIRRAEADRDALDSLEPLARMRLLEIGPGSGLMTSNAMARNANVVALDLSMEALVLTRERCERRVHCVCADAGRLPFRSGRFDRVAVFSVLMFLNLDEALCEFDRVLRRNGSIALVEPLKGNPMIEVWRRWAGRYDHLATWLDPDEFRVRLASMFSIVALQGYYHVPVISLLPDGPLRKSLLKIERLLFGPASLRAAWIGRALLRKRHV